MVNIYAMSIQMSRICHLLLVPEEIVNFVQFKTKSGHRSKVDGT